MQTPLQKIRPVSHSGLPLTPPEVPPAEAEPPAVEPPAAEPPAVEPPAVDPPAPKPPAVEPPAAPPPADVPPADAPPADAPPASPPAMPPPTPCTWFNTQAPNMQFSFAPQRAQAAPLVPQLLTLDGRQAPCSSQQPNAQFREEHGATVGPHETDAIASVASSRKRIMKRPGGTGRHDRSARARRQAVLRLERGAEGVSRAYSRPSSFSSSSLSNSRTPCTHHSPAMRRKLTRTSRTFPRVSSST